MTDPQPNLPPPPLSLAEFITVNRPCMVAAAFRILRDWGEAEDAAQKAWINYGRRFGNGDVPESALVYRSNWLLRAVSHRVFDRLRQMFGRDDRDDDGSGAPGDGPDGPSPHMPSAPDAVPERTRPKSSPDNPPRTPARQQREVPASVLRVEGSDAPDVLERMVSREPSGEEVHLNQELAAAIRACRDKLRDKERVVFVLCAECDLDRQEVAAQLKIPAGRVSSQLHRAMTRMAACLNQSYFKGREGEETKPDTESET